MNVDLPKPEAEMTGEEKAQTVIGAVATALTELVDVLEAEGIQTITTGELRGIVQDMLSPDA